MTRTSSPRNHALAAERLDLVEYKDEPLPLASSRRPGERGRRRDVPPSPRTVLDERASARAALVVGRSSISASNARCRPRRRAGFAGTGAFTKGPSTRREDAPTAAYRPSTSDRAAPVERPCNPPRRRVTPAASSPGARADGSLVGSTALVPKNTCRARLRDLAASLGCRSARSAPAGSDV